MGSVVSSSRLAVAVAGCLVGTPVMSALAAGLDYNPHVMGSLVVPHVQNEGVSCASETAWVTNTRIGQRVSVGCTTVS